jgi:hypothetical protein
MKKGTQDSKLQGCYGRHNAPEDLTQLQQCHCILVKTLRLIKNLVYAHTRAMEAMERVVPVITNNRT